MGQKTSEQIMQPNTASALCYVPFLGFLPAIVFLAIHKEKRVRWNATQSLLTYGLYVAIYFGLVPLLTVTVVLIPIAVLIGGIAWVGFMIAWLMLAARASQGQEMKLPYVGKWADIIIKK